jgi:malonate-semialdehyde dehydrogenase (acetylating)/methylmalonate-semialdehyde dehydrogenase
MTIIGYFSNSEPLTDDTRLQNGSNPATGKAEKTVSLAPKKTMESAIGCAHAAFPQWRKTPPIERARVMFRFKELLIQDTYIIVKLVGEEHSKICHDAAGELQRGIENVGFVCGVPKLQG